MICGYFDDGILSLVALAFFFFTISVVVVGGQRADLWL